jgi:hypothetical protein
MADPQNHLPVQRIVSGGQTGVDRGALDAAIELNLPHGGWCPLGRLAEDGFIPTKYALRQTDTDRYSDRTERNLLDADGTLILYRRQMTGGTELTHLLCRRHGRPVLTVDLDDTVDLIAIRQWLVQERIVALNVAGPRESTSPGIQAAAKQLLCELFGGVT